ncbi:MAG TPA: hypothetical protein VN900_09320 [Stellaceae bacterium]|jgi:hypothetical protein|nr:hypothetical protein [Stellaceae bacterium]
MPEHHENIVKSPTDARSASKEGVVRYILAISIALVVILFIVGYMVS